MKVYHVCCGRPIGPTWEAYLNPVPKDVLEMWQENNPYGIWVEETTMESLANEFSKHLEYAEEHFPKSYFPFELKIKVNHDGS